MFSVVIGHIGYALPTLISSSTLLFLYQAISAGSNAVQVLFVLSGFLIAALYPSVPHPLQFIQKRYMRIFPAYVFFVFTLWLLSLDPSIPVLGKFAVVLALSFCTYVAWRLIKRSSKYELIGKTLFWALVLLQITMLAINLFIIVRPLTDSSKVAQDILVLLSNITLTTPFSQDIFRLVSVFWSLAPEVLFYLLYPSIGMALIRVSKKYGFIMSLIVVAGVTKILFDLDYAVVATATLQNMNIARASGFVAGVTIGVIYQSGGIVWKKIQPILSSRICNVLAICMLIIMQGSWEYIHFGSDTVFMNTYYIVTSWIIAFVILTSISSRALLFKVLSNRLLVFLGLISYSLYLSHSHVAEWLKSISIFLDRYLSPNNASLALLFIVCAVSIAVASVIFYFIERFYFESKKSAKQQVVYLERKLNAETLHISKRKTIFISILTCSILFFLYCDYFPPTVLIQRNSLQGINGKDLLNRNINISFTPKANYLSDIYLHLRYVDPFTRKNDDHLKLGVAHFRLLDEQNEPVAIFTKRAYDIGASPFMQIHFPVIHESAHKKYTLEMSLRGGGEYDQVVIDTAPGMTSVYHDVHNPLYLGVNRMLYVLGNHDFVFAYIFIIFITVAYLSLSDKKMDQSKL